MTPPKRFRIAFSFAGEQRDYVAEVAGLLAARFGQEAILYDEYHQAEFANPNLAFDLPKLYRDQSDLIVPVFCPEYASRKWCRLEWRAIYSIIMARDPREIMPLRFGQVLVDDLHGLSGFIELDGETPQRVAELILERLALNEGRPGNHYKARPAVATSIPHNLPGLQPFFGRERELKLIADALDPDNPTWGALIDGPGGMGKTSLAVRAAYAAPPEDFTRIIFISLKTRELEDDGERDMSGFILTGLQELYNELARELGQLEIPKAREGERPRMLLDALRGTKTLLLLDNLESLKRGDRGTILTFVKKLSPGCKAILTSRGRIGSGTEELILGQLGREAALDTLEELAKHNPELAKTSEAERIELYTQTAGKPLLLRWTAGQLGRGHCRTFTDAIKFLLSCPQGNDSLEFIFGDLVEDLTLEEMKAIAALSYFTQPVKVGHIAALAGLEEQPCVWALNGLVNRSLAVFAEESQAFVLVPVVTAFLREHRREQVAETGARLEEQAYSCIVENGYDEHRRFPVLDAAWDGVAPALPLFLAGPNERLQQVCDALPTFLEFTGRWDEALALMLQAEEKAVLAGDPIKAGWRAYDAGYVHFIRGQADEVLGCAGRADRHWQDPRAGIRERASAVRLRGHGLRMKADYPGAITAYRQAYQLFRSLSAESEDVSLVLNAMAHAWNSSGNSRAAERNYQRALRVARAAGYPEGVANFTGNLAGVALSREDWAEAESLSREALALCEQVGRQELIAVNCERLARALARQDKPAAGLPHARRAVEIYTRLGTPSLGSALETLYMCGG